MTRRLRIAPVTLLVMALLLWVGWEFAGALRDARANYETESHNLALSDEAKITQRLSWMRSTLNLVAADKVLETFVAAGGGLPPMAQPRVQPVFELLDQNAEVLSLHVVSFFTAPADPEVMRISGSRQAGQLNKEAERQLGELVRLAVSGRSPYLAGPAFTLDGYTVFFYGKPIVHRDRRVGLVACLFRANELTYGLSPLAVRVREAESGLTLTLPQLVDKPGRLYNEELLPAEGWSLSLNRPDRFFWERDDGSKAIQGALLKLLVVGLGLIATSNFIRRREAQAASRAKSELMANISHDIRSPLNGVIGLTQLALKTEVTPVQSEYLRTVSASAESVVSLLNDLLDLSRMEAGALEFSPRETDLWDLLYTVTRSFHAQAREKELELVLQIAPRVPLKVTVDPLRLSQILYNLVGNAVKFTHQGHVVLAVQGRDSALEFSVEDTGIGISPQRQAAVFDPFQQAHRGIVQDYGGTGLGLSICRELLSRMDSRLQLESEPGVGSRFSFQLCLESSAAPQPGEVRFRAFVLDELPPRTSDALSMLLQGWGLVRRDEWQEGALILSGRPAARLPADRPADCTPVLLVESPEELAQESSDLMMLRPVNPKTLLELVSGEKPRPSDSLKAPRALRVLLVDDGPINQKLGRLMLEELGHRVEIASSGAEALALVKAGEFDLVLMDLHMPELDGIEVTRQMRGTGFVNPIVALTGHALSADREKCLAAGMQAHLAKPLDEKRLQEVLHNLFAYEGAPAGAVVRPNSTSYWRGPVFDAGQALRRVGGDPRNLARVIRLFEQVLERERAKAFDSERSLHDRLKALRTLRSAVEPFEARAAGAAIDEFEQKLQAGAAAQPDVRILDSALQELAMNLHKFATEKDV